MIVDLGGHNSSAATIIGVRKVLLLSLAFEQMAQTKCAIMVFQIRFSLSCCPWIGARNLGTIGFP